MPQVQVIQPIQQQPKRLRVAAYSMRIPKDRVLRKLQNT